MSTNVFTFSEYQMAAHATAGKYEAACVALADCDSENKTVNGKLMRFLKLSYVTHGLAGEAGEFPNKVKKILRDDNGEISPEKAKAMAAELGDILWYLAEACTVLGVSFEDVAVANVAKLADRAERGVIGGSGDNR